MVGEGVVATAQKHIGGRQSEGRGPFVSFPQERLPPVTEQQLRQWPLVRDAYPIDVRKRRQRIRAARARPMTLVHQAPTCCLQNPNSEHPKTKTQTMNNDTKGTRFLARAFRILLLAFCFLHEASRLRLLASGVSPQASRILLLAC